MKLVMSEIKKIGIVNQDDARNYGTQIGTQIGDINNTIIQGEISFEEVFLDEVILESFSTPGFINTLVECFDKQKLVVLVGNRKIKKANVARYIAYSLQRRSSGQDPNHRFSLKESVHSLAIGSRLKGELLRSSDTSTIFILSDISAKTFGNDLAELEEIAREKDHYIIVSIQVEGLTKSKN